MKDAAFYLLAGLTLIPALYVVRGQNLFHAGIALITCFLGVAGLYITLEAPFVAGLQVLIYAGAIAVILLFAFMLTHDLMRSRMGRTQGCFGLVCALLVASLLVWTAVASFPPLAAPAAHDVLGVETLSRSYLTTYFVAFQLVALLLLVSLVGAVVIARKEEKPQ